MIKVKLAERGRRFAAVIAKNPDTDTDERLEVTEDWKECPQYFVDEIKASEYSDLYVFTEEKNMTEEPKPEAPVEEAPKEEAPVEPVAEPEVAPEEEAPAEPEPVEEEEKAE